mgnify:CR=1 FL=1
MQYVLDLYPVTSGLNYEFYKEVACVAVFLVADISVCFDAFIQPTFQHVYS